VLAVMDLTTRRRLETMRRDFVANVSHELKTPLTVISGFAETLLDESLAPDARSRFVATIHLNARRMQRIVDDLLDLSRYESGTWIPARTRVDLNAVIEDVFEEVRMDADTKGIVLDRDVRTAEPLLADPTGIRQILANLVENAVRYTNSGRVTVAAARSDGRVELTVHDTGIGIPPEHLQRIFERFYRVDPGRSRAEGGTGLGLSIVRHLVEAHGGTVTARSEVGRGTTVTVRLPG
jgi:two-component system, OmpR family, phosphate regulon sensor histidine kinase PhoR